MLRWLGIFAILLFSFLGFISWRELQNLPETPQHTTLAEASSLVTRQKAWVIIDDIQWDCNHIYYKEVDRNTHTDIVFTNESRNVWGFAYFSSETTCDEAMKEEAVGILDFANDKKRADLTNNGFDVSQYEKNSKFLSLCTYCGRSNSRTGVILSSIMVILGASLIVASIRIEKKNKQSLNKMYVSSRKRA
jgi:hypothetical protein